MRPGWAARRWSASSARPAAASGAMLWMKTSARASRASSTRRPGGVAGGVVDPGGGRAAAGQAHGDNGREGAAPGGRAGRRPVGGADVHPAEELLDIVAPGPPVLEGGQRDGAVEEGGGHRVL